MLSLIGYAGLVLHAGRHIPSYQNRGQDSLLIYHSIMVLWTYSMMVCDYARKTRSNTPTMQFASQHPITTSSNDTPSSTNPTTTPQRVFIDDPSPTNRTAIDAFIQMSVGTPYLRTSLANGQRKSGDGDKQQRDKSDEEVCDLAVPSQVMKLGVELLDSTHPDVDRQTGPPLLRALCELIEELGGLR
jgi:hypothetical protein